MLVGKELLDKARSLSNRSEDDIARGCGYVGPSGRLLKKSFYRALVEAKAKGAGLAVAQEQYVIVDRNTGTPSGVSNPGPRQWKFAHWSCLHASTRPSSWSRVSDRAAKRVWSHRLGANRSRPAIRSQPIH
jgi:hypothetical protein